MNATTAGPADAILDAASSLLPELLPVGVGALAVGAVVYLFKLAWGVFTFLASDGPSYGPDYHRDEDH